MRVFGRHDLRTQKYKTLGLISSASVFKLRGEKKGDQMVPQAAASPSPGCLLRNMGHFFTETRMVCQSQN